MGRERLIEEAKGHVRHVIAPTLVPNVKGVFQVRLIGVHRNACEIELRVVDPDSHACLKSFGSKVISPGKTITLEGLESTVNFLPRELGG